MKKLFLIFSLVFSTLMFSPPSYSEWTKVGSSANGNTFYVDYKRIRKHGGYVYWWDLTDLLKPDKDGDWSYKIYNQGDCRLFRYKRLNFHYHKGQMAGGTHVALNLPDKNWKYPSPNSSSQDILKQVCSR